MCCNRQCISLLLFAFIAINAYCVGALFIDPPKSSYWMRYSPSYAFSNIKSLFFSSSPPIFLTEKANQADTKTIVNQLITLRRLETSGSDSEEE